MKIGIIGLGSIGQRHARSLTRLGYKEIYALRTKRGTIKELPEDLKHIKEIYDEKEFYSQKLDGVIISNPTSLHIRTTKKALKKKIAVFVEKPIATSMEEIKELKGLDTSKVLVGFDFRYDDAINTVKKFIDSGKIGRILKANLYCGQFLPMWHPYADYRKEYFSRKDLGGGVIRTLCHEIDIMHYLFGVPIEVIGVVEKISELDIDVDDNTYLICRMRNNAVVTNEVDYLNPKGIRNGIIFGSNGIIEYSYAKPSVVFTDNKGNKKILYQKEKTNWDKTFEQEMKDFIELIRNGKRPCSTFEDGINVMRVIEKAEESARSKSWEKIME